VERFRVAGLRRITEAVGTTGNLRRPLIELHGTFDNTAPLRGTRLYAADVIRKGRAAYHRVYEVEHGGHRDKFRDPPTLLTQIEPIGLKFIAGFEGLRAGLNEGGQRREASAYRPAELSWIARRQLVARRPVRTEARSFKLRTMAITSMMARKPMTMIPIIASADMVAITATEA
jgi:hypothetical protein